MTQDSTDSAARAPRGEPAKAPVIATRDLEPGAATATPPQGPGPHPMIESTLVGNGDGLDPATRKTAEPLRLTDPVEETRSPAGDSLAGNAVADTASDDDDDRPTGSATDATSVDAAPLATESGGARPNASAMGIAAPSPAAPPGPSEPKVIERTVVQRKGGFVPTVLGGAVAACLGAGAAWWAMPHLPPEWQRGGAPLVARPDLTAEAAAIEARSVEAARKVARDAADAAVKASLAALPPGEDSAAAMAPLAQRIDALEPLAGQVEALAPLAQRVEALDAQLRDLAARPAGDPAAEQAAQQTAQALARRVDELAAQIAAADARIAEVQTAANDAASRARAASAAATLAQALDRPVAPEAQSAAVEVLTESGVQNAARLADIVALPELQARWDGAARAALRAANAAGEQPSGGNAITSFLRAQTGARSVVPREGTDPDAVLSRAGDAVKRGDIAAAVGMLDGLPPAAREPLAKWEADARAWLAASAAMGELTAEGAVSVEPAAPAGTAPAATTHGAAAPASN